MVTPRVHGHHIGVALDHHRLVTLGDVAWPDQGQQDRRLLVGTVSGVLMYFASIVSSSKMRRAPKPMTSLPLAWIGQSRRRWKRSIGPWRPPRQPAASSFELNPLRSKCLSAYPSPTAQSRSQKCCGRRVELRSSRYCRAGAASPTAGRQRDSCAAAWRGSNRCGSRSRCVSRGCTRVGDGVADPVGEQLTVDEADALDLLEKRVDVAALAQPKQ